ncbi:imidazole glycerol phosphate synthase subunit HisH [Wenzhouxiangella sp. XN79A]|uniref:imidazole glycerol phosphate synthase subunit HisH n=1 Tax=Wenzhouxiangella sp. XN79A TaxID=2724193 RepID=UPI00144A7FAA|nr:imidazole glycerol phosphate synthase subunit HisH [Wenzhouxiangella sp. XN79A]NKI33871.1 imidazole glycerol phosphate synthase subunit HisH [Wenzhouxiangella sp. XN79A]
MTLAVIDSGGANLGSVVQALHRIGAEATLTSDAATIRRASKVILPGVGAAAWAMNALREAGLVDVIRSLEQPVLGICLGLQLLFEGSDEGNADGLGLIPGRVRRLVGGPGLRLPHMGWNQLAWQRDDPLAAGIDPDAWYYFVHSYCAPADSPACVARGHHGDDFAAVVRHRNFAACQFHPEKSAGPGHRLLMNFLES